MLVCPICQTAMKGYSTNKGDVFVCPSCGARAATLKSLNQEHAPRRVRDFVSSLWKQVHENPKRGRPCPHCQNTMLTTASPGEETLWMDVCTKCGLVFFDPFEYEKLTDVRAAATAAAHPPPLPKPPSAATGKEEYFPAPRQKRAPADESLIGFSQPTSAWQVLPALLGMPVELEDDMQVRRPYVTITLSLAMAVMFVWMVVTNTLDVAIDNWGFIPAQWARHGGLTLLTSFFLHAGFLHLIGNLYFLVIFGNNVEQQLGGLAYIFLLIVAHLAGVCLHSALDPNANIALVGASAGIGGVIAYYAVAFPKARIGIAPIPILAFIGFIRIPAAAALVIYIVIQIIGANAQIRGFSSVSSLAHIGGLAVGIVFAVVMRVRGPHLQLQAA
jgi:membrane associated rhomboid family serine protease/Zn-finger nucleic acid-binding protein